MHVDISCSVAKDNSSLYATVGNDNATRSNITYHIALAPTWLLIDISKVRIDLSREQAFFLFTNCTI